VVNQFAPLGLFEALSDLTLEPFFVLQITLAGFRDN
jgi:hypothetical protein